MRGFSSLLLLLPLLVSVASATTQAQCLASCRKLLRDPALCVPRCAVYAHGAAATATASPATTKQPTAAPSTAAQSGSQEGGSFCMRQCIAAIHSYPQCLDRCNREDATRKEVLPSAPSAVHAGEHSRHVIDNLLSKHDSKRLETNENIHKMLFRGPLMRRMGPMINARQMELWRKLQGDRMRKMETAEERRMALEAHRDMVMRMQMHGSEMHAMAAEREAKKEAEQLQAAYEKEKQEEAVAEQLRKELSKEEELNAKKGGLSKEEADRLKAALDKEMDEELALKKEEAKEAEEERRLHQLAVEEASTIAKERTEEEEVAKLRKELQESQTKMSHPEKLAAEEKKRADEEAQELEALKMALKREKGIEHVEKNREKAVLARERKEREEEMRLAQKEHQEETELAKLHAELASEQEKLTSEHSNEEKLSQELKEEEGKESEEAKRLAQLEARDKTAEKKH